MCKTFFAGGAGAATRGAAAQERPTCYSRPAMTLRIAASLSVLLASACAGPQPLLCPPPQRSAAVADLLFGRHVGGRPGVGEAAWRAFLAAEVTPRFPDGLTVVDAAGQWRDTDTGRIVREPSKIVSIVLPDRADNQAQIDAVVAAYKARFRQQAVGVVIRPACVAF